MNVAITGITGMVGSHFIKKIYEENSGGSRPNLRALIREGSVVDHLKTFEDVDYVLGDLANKESLAKLVEGMDTLIHLAHYPGPVQTADELVQVNVNGTFDLLEAARKARVKQVVFASSCTVFGQILPGVDADHPLDESHPVMPGSLYGSIKASIEAFCFFYQRSRAFDLTILRPVTIYGVKPQIDKSEWFNTIDYLATNYNVDLKGSTKYVSVNSVVQALEKVMGNKDCAGKIYHLVDGHIHNLDLGRMIVETIDSFGEIEGNKGEDGVPMSNEAARQLGVEFYGEAGIVEYIKLIHKLQMTHGGERLLEQW
ncbi:MAG: NAD-dependent epimerase/dehydratase family protein [Nitrospinaceae bacterium]|nr:NAD(P)-dependent oxidoreductase [Nitrospinaceae bacterium]NIR56943.1 NAD(P)-dependent oxidoreductase [Nitrospinaceae bacterium]NIS87399.1 NAD(P)-dependent oxidoreductase [Nitrospinaceae bacterium]NIT84251.1 NAD(P)-dependent oxidoreductase [Nitrospinaceae bacterium]NIU46439.1 NAD(P)-dependent oxidoreductase [Nitrospinaceae bacterium]